MHPPFTAISHYSLSPCPSYLSAVSKPINATLRNIENTFETFWKPHKNFFGLDENFTHSPPAVATSCLALHPKWDCKWRATHSKVLSITCPDDERVCLIQFNLINYNIDSTFPLQTWRGLRLTSCNMKLSRTTKGRKAVLPQNSLGLHLLKCLLPPRVGIQRGGSNCWKRPI